MTWKLATSIIIAHAPPGATALLEDDVGAAGYAVESHGYIELETYEPYDLCPGYVVSLIGARGGWFSTRRQVMPGEVWKTPLRYRLWDWVARLGQAFARIGR